MNATVASKPAVRVSGNAHRDYSALMRRWTGWKDKCTLIFGPTDETLSPYAYTDMKSGVITVNVDNLLLNPNRVINTVTPFRLRQEGILTGAMLHEAGHARYTHWHPMTAEGVKSWVHGDGEKVTKAQYDLAMLTEEPRIEALMAANAGRMGATNLAWTMRAMAHAVLPPTELSSDPNQMIMDVISSWVLRAGREIALDRMIGHKVRNWVGDFNTLLNGALTDHLTAQGTDIPDYEAKRVVDYLIDMMTNDGSSAKGYANKRTYSQVNTARRVLEILFPNTPPEEMPSAGGGCASEFAPGEGEGSGSNEAGEGEGSGEGEGDGTEQAMAEAMAAALGAALAKSELTSKVETRRETKDEFTTPALPGGGAGTGGTMLPPGFRMPSPTERDMKRRAERFLRDLIDPSEASKTLLTEAPSATVDPAEMAAWKAGGQVRDPRFFRRVQRQAQPTPPVRIAVLVDISSSMDAMQKPSALLSWAVAAAAFDLRNFAGRGSQVESCLIHWGTSINVIQSRGQMLKGIYTTPCNQGTNAMNTALAEVESQMPGFFDASAKPENRLLIQFTDWELWNGEETAPWIHRALGAGVNMLSVVPRDFNHGRGTLQPILDTAPKGPGISRLTAYDLKAPEAVWAEAAAMLGDKR